jgi:hypothetical protein
MDTRQSATWRWPSKLRKALEQRPDLLYRAAHLNQGNVGSCYYMATIVMLVMSSVARDFFLNHYDILVKKFAHIPRRGIEYKFSCDSDYSTDAVHLAYHAATMLEHITLFAELCVKLYKHGIIFHIRGVDNEHFTYRNTIGDLTAGGTMEVGGVAYECIEKFSAALELVSSDVDIDTKFNTMDHEHLIRIMHATSWNFVLSRLVGMIVVISYYDDDKQRYDKHATSLAYCSHRHSFITYNSNDSEILLKSFSANIFIEKSEREFISFVQNIFAPGDEFVYESNVIIVLVTPIEFGGDDMDKDDDDHFRRVLGWQPEKEHIIQFVRIRGYDGFATQTAIYLKVPKLDAFVVTKIHCTSPFLQTIVDDTKNGSNEAADSSHLPDPFDFVMRILHGSVNGKIRRIDSEPLPYKVCRRPKTVADKVVAIIDAAMRCERPIVDCDGMYHLRGKLDTSIADMLVERYPSHRKRKVSKIR